LPSDRPAGREPGRDEKPAEYFYAAIRLRSESRNHEITMTRPAIALVVSAAALMLSSARADSRVRVGISVGIPAYSYPHPAPVVVHAPPPAVAYAVPPTVVYAPAPAVVVAAPRGYWKEVQVRTWVPERWVVRTNRWGRAERHCEPGYFAYRTERVWVDGRSSHPHVYSYGHGRHSPGHSYSR
jgi:hypothetical protein